MTKIKALIFDWGGVLIDDPIPHMRTYIAREIACNEISVGPAIGHHLNDYAEGIMEEAEFWKNVTARISTATLPKPDLWYRAFKSGYREKKKVFECLEKFKKTVGVKVAILSNTEPAAVRLFNEQGYSHFDVKVFSCDEKCRKPDNKIYNITVERLNLNHDECLFIDDRIENIEAAQKLNINAIFAKPGMSENEIVALIENYFL